MSSSHVISKTAFVHQNFLTHLTLIITINARMLFLLVSSNTGGMEPFQTLRTLFLPLKKKKKDKKKSGIFFIR